jgi:hypothetical protein
MFCIVGTSYGSWNVYKAEVGDLTHSADPEHTESLNSHTPLETFAQSMLCDML